MIYYTWYAKHFASPYYNSWEQELRELAVHHTPTQEMMDVAGHVLATPSAVTDLNDNSIFFG